LITDLDNPAGLDPVRVGAKAAALAAARAAGAAVLPGFVVDGAASRGHMDLGASTLPERGSGGARLVVSGSPIVFAPELVAAGDRLGERLVARSSTLLESSGEWSGAFASYVDIGPGDLPKAVAGCWASVFSVAALERQEAAGIAPGSFPMSVLVQPAVEPETGGWAELSAGGDIVVHGIKGSPGPLLQGWATGHSARFRGRWAGDELIELVGISNLEAIRVELEIASEAIGANRCEWALSDRVWALQFGQTSVSKSVDTPLVLGADIPDAVVDLVRVLVMAPGALGEEMVIPWAMGGLPSVDVVPDPGGSDPIGRARDLCRELTEDVWGLPWAKARDSAQEAMSGLRGTDPRPAIERLLGLRAPDPARSLRLLGILRGLRLELSERGVVADQHDAWHLGLEAVESALEGRTVSMPTRIGIGRWEPLVASVVLATMMPRRGTPVSPGIGAGRRVDVADPHEARSERRGVVTAIHPVPNLASLLWDAAGLVTRSGSPAAHLFEAARALRLPAVCGLDLGEVRDEVLAVDGHGGAVAGLSLEQEL